ncbi:DUF488 domain-containing protein [Geobacter hydrogenophilus]|uniref:DNA repair protein n=1 Tax=Geobacter hydrogenophilus TaxID=40983 RepID=A0A9W6LD01_9BACT|nr:DUF488 domain-containing protein [Geobacter hydrogenophilus]MBT0893354.1 DUF488 domain-containing protein [Geobacter hydrogenophilus]GLI37951.1 hypothetical protein GHYDROH2_14520 [Geobacter hydrogenophilus]
MQLTLYTVGHSTRSLEDFVALLRAHGIRQLADVRTIPRSRHNPQFNRDTLGTFLRNRRIGYRHMKELGGLRHARADSVNMGWHNASFRGFADYMQTPVFAAALEKLIALASKRPTAIMCAEAVPWRCHRSLIGDALVVRGIEVKDIMGINSVKQHLLTAMARVEEGQVTYPVEGEENSGASSCGIGGGDGP